MSRGHDRERAVKAKLQADDWLVVRAAGSLGPVDLVALKDGQRPKLIEVKSTAGGPYERFGPQDRADMKALAEWAGAEAWLCWWPPRGQLRFIAASEWPVAPVRSAPASPRRTLGASPSNPASESGAST